LPNDISIGYGPRHGRQRGYQNRRRQGGASGARDIAPLLHPAVARMRQPSWARALLARVIARAGRRRGWPTAATPTR
jgi:hypothetical protein